jgi:AcrR family transcriptional regulator
MDAAAEVFGEKGFRAASLTDVADRAGYTIGAVYSNFTSKDELFRAMMAERLRMFEAGLAASLAQAESMADEGRQSSDDRMEHELDRIAGGEASVPSRWWRLLYEYRSAAAADPQAWAELALLERRCRELVAQDIARVSAALGLVPNRPPIELAELTMALVDGLRAAHDEGRSTMTSSEGLRLVTEALMLTATRVDPG